MLTVHVLGYASSGDTFFGYPVSNTQPVLSFLFLMGYSLYCTLKIKRNYLQLYQIDSLKYHFFNVYVFSLKSSVESMALYVRQNSFLVVV